LQDLGEEALELPRLAPRLRATLAGLSPGVAEANLMARHIGAETSMRHLIGVDPSGHGVAIAGSPEPGMQLRFCRRDVDAARRDLVRLCAEVREELEQRREARMASMLPHAAANVGAPQRSLPARGAVYISCTGRGGAHFGGPSAELALVRQHLGDLPLIGFFAAGEIAGDRLYGYTGVLTVFSENPAM
jgi:small ligand-binding sensory domain FIST